MASEQSARERMLEQAEAQINRVDGQCAECGSNPSHYPDCDATAYKALDLALARIAELERETMCGVCGGTPPSSGLPCICGGTNKAHQEAYGARVALVKAEMRIAELERERDEAKQIAADYIARTDPILDQLEPLHDRVRELTRERDEARAALEAARAAPQSARDAEWLARERDARRRYDAESDARKDEREKGSE